LLITSYGTEWPVLSQCAVKKPLTHSLADSVLLLTAHNGLYCADVPLRNYSLTHSLTVYYFYHRDVAECLIYHAEIQGAGSQSEIY